MRGKGKRSAPRSRRSGITPAHAGKSLAGMQARKTLWDHPRTCGEKQCVGAGNSAAGGSPPHMRGKGVFFSWLPPEIGITPAHAGKSRCGFCQIDRCRDHPRTCGEKNRISRISLHELGSPPHMRGKGLFCVLGAIRVRITPAHAGKRLSQSKSSWKIRDHPRTCGEKCFFRVVIHGC